MLNKELLLASKKEAILKPTHTVEVVDFGYGVGFDGIGDGTNYYGFIDPLYFLDKLILALYTDIENNVTKISLWGVVGVNQLYLVRLDTEKVVVLRDIDNTTGTASGTVEFFTHDDAGKSIPIWIGENLPPSLV